MPPDKTGTYGINISLYQVYHNQLHYARCFSLYTMCKEKSQFLYLSPINNLYDLLKFKKVRRDTFILSRDVVKYKIHKMGSLLNTVCEREKHGTGTGNSSGRDQRRGI